MRTLFLRADANPRMGTGHLMRCLALAQAWKEAGGEACFLTACTEQAILHRLYGAGRVYPIEHPSPDPRDFQQARRFLGESPGKRKNSTSETGDP